jgi:CarD family transcriptional regulator
MFELNDQVVYPGHGVARISGIVEQAVEGNAIQFYELSFVNQGTTILVPVHHAEQVGLRSLSSQEHIQDALHVIAQPSKKVHHHELSASSWNKRNKQYQLKLRKGGLVELSEIYRDLRFIQTQKELSFGEKVLLQKTESLLAEEISLVQQRNEQATVAKIRSLCRQTQSAL